MNEVPLMLALIAGLVSFLSPCVLPLVPAYIGYMGGQVTVRVSAQTAVGAIARPTLLARLSILLHSIAFVLGFMLVFVSIGVLSTSFVRVVGRQNISAAQGVISRAGGTVIILFGLHMLGALNALFTWLLAHPEQRLRSPLIAVGLTAAAGGLTMWIFQDWLPAIPVVGGLLILFAVNGAFTTPHLFWAAAIARVQETLYADTRRQRIASGQQSYWGSLTMGIVFAAGWTPCIGPIYGAILTVAAGGGDVGMAAAQLTAYSLGLGIPFIVTALLLDSAGGLLRLLQRHVRKIERFAGALLIAIGILVASEQLQAVSLRLVGQFGAFAIVMEECTQSLYYGEIGVGDFIGCVNEASAPVSVTPAPS